MSETPNSQLALRTIKDFIDDHERLLAVIGILTGLAVLWGQLPSSTISPTVPLWCMLATLPLYWEIFRRFDFERSTWSLVVFVNLFTPIAFSTTWYVFVAFRPQWVDTMPRVVGMVLLLSSWGILRLLPIKKLVYWFLRKIQERTYRTFKIPPDESEQITKDFPTESFAVPLYWAFLLLAFGICLIAIGQIREPLAKLINDQMSEVMDTYKPTPSPTPTVPSAGPSPIPESSPPT